VLEGFSRSGNVREIVTLTGRVGLWHFVIEQIKLAPLFGHGYGASRSVLAVAYQSMGGWDAPHAHNMLLQSVHSIGLIGTLFLVLTLTGQAILLLTSPLAMRDLLFFFIVVIGVTEAGILRPEFNSLTLMWLLSMFTNDTRYQPNNKREEIDAASPS
jgi:O-antigen ligase